MEESSVQELDSFNDVEIKAIVAFEVILRKIHDRLIKEGYVIKNGKITLPELPVIKY